MNRARDRTRGALAALVLLAAVVGAPVALWHIATALDLHTPAGGWVDSLTRPDDGNLLVLALLALGWICWAAFTLATLTEATAALRGLPAPRIPGLAAPQRAAAALIAAVALLAPAGATTPTHAPAVSVELATVAGTTPMPLRVTPAVARTGDRAPAATHDQPATPTHAKATSDDLPVITVHRHDTLWHLAQVHLGAGERWTEIYRLNRDRPQPDGRALHDPDWIYPGWQLRLPRDAHHLPQHQAGTTTVDESQPTQPKPVNGSRHQEQREHRTAHRQYQVKAGDNLWDIAGAQLGDPARWREIYRLNKNLPQPDGQALNDPQLIMPGWRLRLPEQTRKPAEHRHVTKPPATTGTEPGPPTPAKPAPEPAPPQRTPTQQPPSQPDALAPPVTRDEPVPAADGPTIAPSTASAPEVDQTAAAVAVDDDPPITESTLLPLLGLGLTAATLTGLVAELTRRRRRQQSSRRPGQRIPMPDPDTAARETTARTHTIPGTVDAVTTALRALAESCRRAGQPIPDLLLVHAAPDGVRLQLTEPDDQALPPFTATSDGRWLLTQDPSTLLAAETDPYPALVSLGVADGAMLLLNLEAVGTLTLTGDPDRVQAAIRAYAVDLAVGPFTGAATLTLTGDTLEPLAATLDPGRSHPSSPDQAARELHAHAAALIGLLDGTPLRQARAERGLDDSTRPSILISEYPLAEQSQPWSGTTLVSFGGDQPNRWRLEVRADGPSVLHPLGLRLDPQQVSEVDYRAVVDLLTTADIEPGHQQPADDANETTQVRVRESLPEPPTPAAAGDVPAFGTPSTEDAPRLLLLGPVQVAGVRDDRAPHRSRRLTELVAYLALHPDATTAQIDEALWPGKRVTSATHSSFISRTRQWLGHDPDGNHYLPLISDGGRLALAKTVTSDWDDFLRHARTGLNDNDPDELTAALDLVRGRPFLGIDDHRYTWAEADIQQVISTITDVAAALAELHTQAGDHRAALRSVLKGLDADDSVEGLLNAGLRAARTLDDQDAARRLECRLRRLDDS